MTKHRFDIGNQVRMLGVGKETGPSPVIVVRQLPADHENLPPRYRIKSPIENYERMVTEDQLIED